MDFEGENGIYMYINIHIDIQIPDYSNRNTVSMCY